jgi:hypothetical protein
MVVFVISGDAMSELLRNAVPQVVKSKLPIPKSKLFLICDDCYWCASALKIRPVEIVTCPQCQKVVSSIPLTDDESYTYSYDKRNGVEVDFWSQKKT